MKLKLRHLITVPVLLSFVSALTAEELPEREFFAVDQELIFLAGEVDKTFVKVSLGDLVVVAEKHLKNNPTLQQHSKSLTSSSKVLVIRDDSGRHGIADGTLLVRLRDGESIFVFAQDYQLQVVEAFRNPAMGRLGVPNLNALLPLMDELSADFRTVYVEPNAQYFDVKSQ